MKTRHRVEVLVLLWLVVAVLFAAALAIDWVTVWGAVGVPAMSPPFADLRTITGGIASSRLGVDPLSTNPRDPWTRTLNYPRLWLWIFRTLGVDDGNVSLVGLVFSAAYLTAVSLLIWRSTHAGLALTIGMCVLSAAPLLAMERGNNDLLIFALVVGAVLSRSMTGVVALGSAVLLKLYPLAAIAHFATVGEARRRAVAWAVLGLALVTVAANYGDLRLIAQGTPSSFRFSYGLWSLRAGCVEHAARWPSIAGLCGTWRLSVALVATMSVLVLAVAGLAWRARATWTPERARSTNADLFVAFAGIYVFTYFTGSNWDYRLIFLIPTLPFFFSLVTLERRSWLGWGSVVAIPVAMNVGMIASGPWTYVGHAAKTGLAFVCVFLLVTLSRARLAPAYRLAD